MKNINPLKAVRELGQSIWLDDIHRGMLNNGDFQQYIDMENIAQQLDDEGLDKFIKPFDVLLRTLESKIDAAK